MIINYDKEGNPGTHWVAIFINPKKGYSEVFDSYGLPPSQIIQKKLYKIGKPILYNSGQIQNELSKRCGWYCIHYILERDRGVEPYDVLYQFKPSPTLKNDIKLINMFK